MHTYEQASAPLVKRPANACKRDLLVHVKETY